ncbi:hypothetical protein [Novosphingobium pentaromativorans]|uniref:Acetaldehyde dehydrogenase n=1 Tax=Novosphingobium pentaromativorans US6-1 TaxID=1088721 RepID=G6E7U4_9SPHN|nr:hypothetical protein [Novosphingobium pentaromativorans]EHJ62586.1 acetaldehyde dehydrogenase [Novosphingobium pentaromativorans US6-1]
MATAEWISETPVAAGVAQFFIVPQTGACQDHPFMGENMTVTMALSRAKDIIETIG